MNNNVGLLFKFTLSQNMALLMSVLYEIIIEFMMLIIKIYFAYVDKNTVKRESSKKDVNGNKNNHFI